MSNYLVEDEDGQPVGIFDPNQISDEGVRLAFRLAAACDDPEAIPRVLQEALDRAGSGAYGYVAAAALRYLVEHVLAPVVEVARAHGTDLLPGLRAIAEGRTPPSASEAAR